MRRFWSHWYGKLGVITLAAIGVLVVAAIVAAHFTESNHFCGKTCHEMVPYYTTWQKSAHRDVRCVRCHIKPGVIELVEAKASALREVYVHFTRSDKQPIAVTEHVDNSVCESCHPLGKLNNRIKLGDVAPAYLSHKAHADLKCIDCHSRVVHKSTPGHPNIDPGEMAFCRRCHDGKQAAGDCGTCHNPPHANRGQCSNCHDMSSWTKSFKHPFTLAGTHASFSCEKCHTHGTSEPGLSCVNCHGKQHGGLTNCASCHHMTAWKPTTFHHPATGMDNWASMACTACHPNNAFATVYCTCHNGKPPSGD